MKTAFFGEVINTDYNFSLHSNFYISAA